MASPLLRDRPRVLSIPAGVSFADTLARELLRQVSRPADKPRMALCNGVKHLRSGIASGHALGVGRKLRQICIPACGELATLHQLDLAREVWMLAAVYVSIQIGVYTVNLWMPLMLNNLAGEASGNASMIARFSTVPYLLAALFTVVIGWSSDRWERWTADTLISGLLP